VPRGYRLCVTRAAPESTSQTGAPAPVCVAIVLPSVQGVEGDATQTASEVASSTKAKDEMRIEYRLSAVSGGTTFGPKTERAKAKVDGEDLLTPLVQKVAEAVAAAL